MFVYKLYITVGCVFLVVVPVLPNAVIRRNDNREGAPHFIISGFQYNIYQDFCQQQVTVELIRRLR